MNNIESYSSNNPALVLPTLMQIERDVNDGSTFRCFYSTTPCNERRRYGTYEYSTRKNFLRGSRPQQEEKRK